MNNSSDKKGRKIASYLIPGIITLLVMIFVLIVKGIWPFGSNRIDLFDNMQQVAPLYAHLWDAMHGDASVWFDWYTGLGTNVSMSISAFSMFSPFNLLLYLCPRDYILEFISILTLVKMFVMSVTMYAFLNRRYKKLTYKTKVIFALAYTFCGYVLLYASCFTPWMDIVALFPLLMMSLDVMEKTGKKFFYILMLALLFVINYYISAMSVVYILLAGGMYIIFRCDKEERRKCAWNLGIGTFTGIGLSAFVLLPVFSQLSQSQRTGNSLSLVQQYMSWISNPTFRSFSLGEFERIMMFYGMGIFLVLIFTGIHRSRKLPRYKMDIDLRKRNWYAVSLFAIMVIQAVAEGTNIMWHFGSYNGYTLRNGFIIAFTFICLAAMYADTIVADSKEDKKKNIILSAVCVVVCVAFALGYKYIPVNSYERAFAFFIAVFAIMLVVHIINVIVRKDGYGINSIIRLMAVEIIIGAIAMTGPPKFYTYTPYQYGDYVQLAVEAANNLEIASSPVDRITNPDLSLNANYPLVMKRGAMSSFTAALQKESQKQTVRWGHSKYFLWMLDSGNTVFSDALIHVTEAVNVNRLDSSLYTLKKVGTDGCQYKLYTANYQLPFAMVTDSSVKNVDFNKDFTKNEATMSAESEDYNDNNCSKDWIYMHNIMYSALSHDSSGIVTEYGTLTDTKEITVNNNQVAEDNIASDNLEDYRTTQNKHIIQTYKDSVTGTKAVYMSVTDRNIGDSDANVSNLFRSVKITVNGKEIAIPTIGNVKNKYYTTDYNNGLIYLGTFYDEDIEVQVEYTRPYDSAGNAITDKSIVTIAGIDLIKMQSLCDKYADKQSDVTYTNNSVTIKVDGSGNDNYAIIPIIKSDNWTVTVNGVKCDTDEIAGILTGVNINDGSNEIVFTFKPSGRNAGIIISLIILIVMIVLMFIDHKRGINVPQWLGMCAGGVYLAIIAVLAVVMFAIPLVASVIANIQYIL